MRLKLLKLRFTASVEKQENETSGRGRNLQHTKNKGPLSHRWKIVSPGRRQNLASHLRHLSIIIITIITM